MDDDGSDYNDITGSAGLGGTTEFAPNPDFDPFAPQNNPFTLPREREVFQMTKDAKAKKEAERQRQKTLHIHEKTTASRVVSKVQLSRGHLTGGKKLGTSAGARGHSFSRSQALDKPEGHRRERRETAAEFIAKKKEMFLLSLSLDTKWTEISKLEERARWREDALKKSEEMLREDSDRFQTFLAENDAKAMEASKRAELETQAKLNKVKEIKRVTAEIDTGNNELAKETDHLNLCIGYKKFLDELTPADWICQQRKRLVVAKFEEEIATERAQKEAAAAAAAEKRASEEEAAAAAAEAAAKNSKGKRSKAAAAQAAQAAAAATASAPTPTSDGDEADYAARRRALEDVLAKIDGSLPASGMLEDELPMYFTDTEQLLAVNHSLEQNNLFLIQQSQDTEEALDKVRAQLTDTKMLMDAELATLTAQILTLKDAIDAERSISARRRGPLKGRKVQGSPKKAAAAAAAAEAKKKSKGAANEKPTPEELKQLIANTYRKVGYQVDASVDPIQMLTYLERSLAQAISEYETLPADKIKEAEKAKNKENRDKKRQDKVAEQKADQERRTQKVLDRATKPVKKRIGKPEMFRSVPPPRRTRRPKQEDKEEKEDLSMYFT